MATVLEPTQDAIRRAARTIDDGGVVVAPSDTNLGIAVDPTASEAIDRTYAAKGRSPDKPLTLFVRDPGAWRDHATHPWPTLVDAIADEHWPGPLNLVLAASHDRFDDRCYGEATTDDEATADDASADQSANGAAADGATANTIAVGSLANDVWRGLAEAVDGPIAMTSANRSGTMDDDELVDVERAVADVGDAVDLVLDAEPEGTTRASTILDCTVGGDHDSRVLRQGDLQPGAIAGGLPLRIR